MDKSVNGKKVLISGGSGLVGRQLTMLLVDSGYEVAWLSRTNRSDAKIFLWDVDNKSIDNEAIEWADVIIHLAGEGVANSRWTAEHKKRILDSRIDSSQLLFEAISKSLSKPEHFISASAIGYYGIDTGDHILKEDADAGSDFLASVTKEWELTVDQIASLDIPVAKVRVGVVLSESGGALEKMTRPIKMWTGAALGSGEQYMSWIHIDDLCVMFLHLVNHRLEGAYNGTAPNPVTNNEMTKAIAKKLNKPIILPNVPPFALKILFGDMAEILVGGNRVIPQKMMDERFSFKYPELETALENILRVLR